MRSVIQAVSAGALFTWCMWACPIAFKSNRQYYDRSLSRLHLVIGGALLGLTWYLS